MGVYNINKTSGSLNLIASRGQFIQYSVMPTPSVDILNKIVQYIGTTTANYTNGYFYKCEETSTNVYGWVNVSVQAGGGGSAEIIKGYFNPSDNLFYEESTYVTPITGDVNSLYLSLDTNLLYRYNGTIFVEVSNYEIGDGLNLDDNTLSADTVIFTGTSTEWNAVVDKSKYDIVNLTDEATGEVVNVVEDGNLNPVTSNAVYDGLSLKANTTAISNPNLLDNPWFTVNQRGQSSYTSDWVYTVDRWLKGESYTLSVGNNGISASVINIDHGHLSQRLDIYSNLVGKTCTLSILKSTGEISSATGVVLSGIGTSMAISDNDIWCALVKDANFDFIALNFKNTTTTVRAVKLELGSVSTLAMDIAPNYQQELAKCQRYFVRYTGAGYPEICHAIESSGLNAWGLCFLPVPMRIKPSIAFANVNAYRLSDDSATAITAMEIHALANNACKIMFTLASNGINGSVAEIQPNSANNGYVDFSADL